MKRGGERRKEERELVEGSMEGERMKEWRGSGDRCKGGRGKRNRMVDRRWWEGVDRGGWKE